MNLVTKNGCYSVPKALEVSSLLRKCFNFTLVPLKVIRNEALLLLTYLTREAEVSFLVISISSGAATSFYFLDSIKPWLFCILYENLIYYNLTFQEIQKILVFEGAFEKIFSIIKEEGGPEGGVVVQVIWMIGWCLDPYCSTHPTPTLCITLYHLICIFIHVRLIVLCKPFFN